MRYNNNTIIIIFIVYFLVGCLQEENTEEIELDYADTSFGIMDQCSTDTLKGIIQGNDVLEYTVLRQSDLLKPVFRIPSAIVTNKGTVLVSCENRSIFDDKGEIDILLSRKELKDTIWHIRNVVQHSKESYGRSMNPVFLIDRNGTQGHKGRIFLFVCHLSGEGFASETTTDQADFVYKYSDDDGKSWSPEKSLKHLWNLSNYTAVLPSAANGIQMHDGTFLLPTMVVKDGRWRSGIVYKRPHQEWFFSRPSQYDGDNECTVYIDNDDRIILDCRTTDNIRRRYYYDIEKDKFTLLKDQPIVKVNLKAEIHKIEDVDDKVYLLTFVDTPTNIRENITLYSSKDAITWDKVYCIKEGVVAGAYSNVTSYDGKVVVVYEKGDEIKVQDISDYKQIYYSVR